MGRTVEVGVRGGMPRRIWWLWVTLVLLFGTLAHAANLVVTVGGEDNTAGTLRDALNTANSNGEPDTITFSLGTTGIAVTSPLDITEDGTTVDGGGQITISGGGANTSDPIWRITSANNVIKNFSLQQGREGGAVQITGVAAKNNAVTGCFIGTDASGSSALGNWHGVVIQSGATGNVVGGLTIEERNVISGNSNYGVYITGAGTNTNSVLGNYIGTTPNGATALSNDVGVYIADQASGNEVGGIADAARNVLSGNFNAGVMMTDALTSSNRVQGNYIGVGPDGASPVPNDGDGVAIAGGASGNLVGGTDPGAGNVLSANDGAGVAIYGTGTSGNAVVANTIGLTVDGSASAGFQSHGVSITSEATENVIGGASAAEGNVISGISGAGIWINGIGTSLNEISGNMIGTNPDGTAAIGNSTYGVYVNGGATQTTIGGPTAGQRNLISGNAQFGVLLSGAGTDGNALFGNYVGTDTTGTVALRNGTVEVIPTFGGVGVDQGASNNTIGGANDGEGNLISGNTSFGIQITGANTSGNKVFGNLVGTDASGSADLGNAVIGISVDGGATSNYIGGANAGEGNVVSGNGDGGSDASGIRVAGLGTTGNLVRGNIVGLDVTGVSALPNNPIGVDVVQSAELNTIGGPTASEGNLIASNTATGVRVDGANTFSIAIRGNSIHSHSGKGILLQNGANTGVAPPAISTLGPPIAGTAANGAVVELFVDELDEGRTHIDTVTASAVDGSFSSGVSLVDRNGLYLTATQTRSGETSEFSAGIQLIGPTITVEPTGGSVVEGEAFSLTVSASGSAPLAYQWEYASDGNTFSPVTDTADTTGSSTDTLQFASIALAEEGFYHCTVSNAVGEVQSNTVSVTVVPANTSSVVVDTLDDNVGGDTTSLAHLVADPGTDGLISLREAITAANNTTGPNTITFSVSGPLVAGSELPALSDLTGGLTIDGGGTVALNGEGLVSTENGLVIQSGANAILNLSILNFPGYALFITGADAEGNVVKGCNIGHDGATLGGNQAGGVVVANGATLNEIGSPLDGNVISGTGGYGVLIEGASTTGNRVAGNRIGTDPTGEQAWGNVVGVGIALGASSNWVGGPASDEGNLISGNGTGVKISGPGTELNHVQQNYIGTTTSGSTGLGNTDYGVLLTDGPSGNVIGGIGTLERNVISGNGTAGVVIESGVNVTTGNFLHGNYIGTDAAGTSSVPNDTGVIVWQGAESNNVGGDNADEGNLVSGNTCVGIHLDGAGTTGNWVAGNTIGFNAPHDAALGNGCSGVYVTNGASGNTIGGVTEPAANLIAGNSGSGIELDGTNAAVSNTVIQGNAVGLLVNGSGAGNGLYGIYIHAGASANLVGGTAAGAGNTVAYNAAWGVKVEDATSTANTIQRNSIHANGDTGIVLLSGGNNGIAAPVITALGSVDGTALAGGAVEIFVDTEDEGETFLDAVTADSTTGAFSSAVDLTGLDGSFVTATVTDGQGNTSAFSEPFFIDLTPPEITLLGDAAPVVECSGIFNDPGAVASDNIDGDLTSSISVSGTVDTAVPGAYNLTYDVSDSSGNSAVTVRRTVTVEDTTSPTIALVGAPEVTINVDEVYVDEGATATDGCDTALPAVSIDDNAVDTTTPGTYTVAFSVTDASGNRGTATRQVTVVDNVPPEITLLGDTAPVVECSDGYTDPGAVATDNVDGDITANISVTGAVDTASPGSYILRYNVSDAAGNAAVEQTRTVTVVDTTPPRIVLNGSAIITVNINAAYADAGASATDSCDTALPAVSVDASAVDTATPGDYTVLFSVLDDAGNEGTATRQVTVVDNVPPEITLLGDTAPVVECGAAFTDPGAVASDNVDGDISGSVVVSGTVDPGTPGEYILSYNVSDAAGNAAATVARTVTVEDTTAPTITLNGSDSVSVAVGQPYTDAGATASDGCDTALAAVAVDSTAVNTGTPGTYTVFFSVSDASGNEGTATRQVTVMDNTPPTITLLGNAAPTRECGEAYTDPGAVASDNIDGDLTAAIVSGGTVDTGTPGDYTLTYDVTDSAGNAAAQVTRTVTVEDTKGPKIVLNGPSAVTIGVGDPYIDQGGTATDTCDQSPIPVSVDTSSVNTDAVGEYTVVLTAADASGNEGQAARTVTVLDDNPPLITLVGPASMALECGGDYEDAGAVASDDEDGDLTASVVMTGSVDRYTPGDYLLRYNVTDAAGNAATEEHRLVRVADTTGPAMALLGDAQVVLDCEGIYTEAGVSVEDTCDPSPTVFVSGDVDVTESGEYLLSYTATDQWENETVITRTVQVLDNCSNLAECLAACEDEPEPVDADGDGLTACQEACHGTDDNNIDTDGDGMPDSFETEYELDPLTDDASEDPDLDDLTNLEEFLRGSSPIDPDSIDGIYFVAKTGSDSTGTGLRDAPWLTIGHAVEAVSPTPERPVRIVVEAGTYNEDVVLRPHTTVEGKRDAVVRISGAVAGAAQAGLEGLEVKAIGPDETLLFMDNKAMRVSNVRFVGTSRQGLGILVRGALPASTVIERCTFTDLSVGIEIEDAIPVIRTSRFHNLGVAGIIIRATSAKMLEKTLGDENDPTTGWNDFDTPSIGQNSVINERTDEAMMQNNYWGAESLEEVPQAVSGPAIIEPIQTKSASLAVASIFATVWDADDQTRITDASVELVVSGFSAVTENSNGVYAFPAVASGAYTLMVDAPGYAEAQQVAAAPEGALLSVIIPLTKQAGEGEGEGEGDKPNGSGCGGTSVSPEGGGFGAEAIIGLLVLTALVASARGRRRRRS